MLILSLNKDYLLGPSNKCIGNDTEKCTKNDTCLVTIQVTFRHDYSSFNAFTGFAAADLIA